MALALFYFNPMFLTLDQETRSCVKIINKLRISKLQKQCKNLKSDNNNKCSGSIIKANIIKKKKIKPNI